MTSDAIPKIAPLWVKPEGTIQRVKLGTILGPMLKEANRQRTKGKELSEEHRAKISKAVKEALARKRQGQPPKKRRRVA